MMYAYRWKDLDDLKYGIVEAEGGLDAFKIVSESVGWDFTSHPEVNDTAGWIILTRAHVGVLELFPFWLATSLTGQPKSELVLRR